jgi:alpha-glucoside transport system substrate-binding protein
MNTSRFALTIACGVGIAVPLIAQGQAAQKQVNILGNFTGNDEAAYKKVIAVFEAKHPDIKINYSGTQDFNTVLNVRVEAGDYPDLAAVPQPGVMKDLAKKGVLLPTPSSVLNLVNKNYSPAWKELGSGDDDKVYGVFHRVNMKGLVFYNKPAFEAAGFKVPKSWAGLQNLTRKMMSSTKIAPWCIGMESGGATGWVATDWLENIMLRTQPVKVYDNWISNKVKFDSPEVRNAWSIMDSIWGDPKAVYGGKKNIAITNFKTSSEGLFTATPQCWLQLQGSFATGFFQESVQAELNKNVGVFVLPMINTKLPNTLEVGGDQYVLFKGKERPEVLAFLEFLATGASAEPWAKNGGGLFPHKDQNLNAYSSSLSREFAKIILAAKSARFDASDSMPAAVNLAFWKGTIDYVTGKSVDQVLNDIDATYK